ncbi:glycosyltransferase family 2 protein, partial [Streptomyces sp. NPDC007070]|uniref:glycosyltransferase family 2 protein n=1 Tax=Streptomyces sp. NPDC007070 TaxID=3154312 RepID=UPI0034033AF6
MIENSSCSPAPVDVVLPCLDEAEALPWVLGRIPAGWRAIVVDNGSTDGSADLARALGAHVVHEPRRGFGAACHAGLTAASADVVCFCDCDASLDPALLPAVAVLEHPAPPTPDRPAGVVDRSCGQCGGTRC